MRGKVYLTPCYLKPEANFMTWVLPMCYVGTEKQEYICESDITPIKLHHNTVWVSEYEMLTMKTDLRGNPEAFKVKINPARKVYIPIKDLIKIASENTIIGTIKGEWKLTTYEGNDFIRQVYTNSRKAMTPIISPPSMWLVYSRKKDALARLQVVTKIKGEIEIRPFGINNIILIADDFNNPLKVNDILFYKLLAWQKTVIDNEWKTMVSSAELISKLADFETETEKEEESEIEKTEEGAYEIEEVE